MKGCPIANKGKKKGAARWPRKKRGEGGDGRRTETSHDASGVDGCVRAAAGDEDNKRCGRRRGIAPGHLNYSDFHGDHHGISG